MNFLGKKLNLEIAVDSLSPLKHDFSYEKYQIYLRKFLDHQIKGIDFNLDDGTEAYFACTTVFEGETLVLGGKREYNQFSKVESCGLKRTNTLPFTENLYAQVYCGTYNFKRTYGQLLGDMESRSNDYGDDYGDDYSDDGNIDYGDDEADLFKVRTIEDLVILFTIYLLLNHL